jgi:hypothetical protein
MRWAAPCHQLRRQSVCSCMSTRGHPHSGKHNVTCRARAASQVQAHQRPASMPAGGAPQVEPEHGLCSSMLPNGCCAYQWGCSPTRIHMHDHNNAQSAALVVTTRCHMACAHGTHTEARACTCVADVHALRQVQGAQGAEGQQLRDASVADGGSQQPVTAAQRQLLHVAQPSQQVQRFRGDILHSVLSTSRLAGSPYMSQQCSGAFRCTTPFDGAYIEVGSQYVDGMLQQEDSDGQERTFEQPDKSTERT